MEGASPKLQLLRELDSTVDFARGYVQLKVLMLLGSGKPLSVKDIGLAINERRRTVIDALRKLVNKGLVVKEEDGEGLYKLTELGKEYLDKLNSLLEGGPCEQRHNNCNHDPPTITLLDIANNIVKYVHLVDALIAVATSKRKELSLTDIADAMKLSPERAKSYIEMYGEEGNHIKLFMRVERRSRTLEFLAKLLKRFGLTVRTIVSVYRITDDGLTVFYKLPYYTKYKRGLVARTIAKIFGSAHPRLILKRAILIFGTITIAIGLLALVTLSSMILALAISFATATGMLYLGYKTI